MNMTIKPTDSNKDPDYFSGSERYYDTINKINIIKVFTGDCYVTNKAGEMMVTILGSCIAACIRDPIAKVGGMNHFLLPDTSGDSTSTRFGAYAMEKLINDILKQGGRKDRLEIKLFGGGNVMKSSARIGERNVEFIRKYIANEGLTAVKEDLGGEEPRRVHYYPETGKVMLRKIARSEEAKKVEKEEEQYRHKVAKEVVDDGDVELF